MINFKQYLKPVPIGLGLIFIPLIGAAATPLIQANGNIKAVGALGYKSTLLTNTIYTPGQDGTYANAQPLARGWHDVLAFERFYAVTQSISTDGTNFSNETTDNQIFARQDTGVGVVGNGERAVRWTFPGVAYNQGTYVAAHFTFSSPTATVTLTAETSADGTSWTSLASG